MPGSRPVLRGRSSNLRGCFGQERDVGLWPIATFRGDAAFQSLSESEADIPQAVLTEPTYEYAPHVLSLLSLAALRRHHPDQISNVGHAVAFTRASCMLTTSCASMTISTCQEGVPAGHAPAHSIKSALGAIFPSSHICFAHHRGNQISATITAIPRQIASKTLPTGIVARFRKTDQKRYRYRARRINAPARCFLNPQRCRLAANRDVPCRVSKRRMTRCPLQSKATELSRRNETTRRARTRLDQWLWAEEKRQSVRRAQIVGQHPLWIQPACAIAVSLASGPA